ncbi:hypothetical protein CQY20_23825 [Mycolicibacterium agri]|uniref:Uncharacterized protein n=1 Tax=Mycolicibacterium agri TaxID=36811 RepID=A0A2A7MT28_MYCAG|nr:hypothetical protein CQY20_23825 [Mycolicibacterium agri]
MVDFTCSLPLPAAAERIVARGPSTSDATPEIAAALGDFVASGRSYPLDTSRPLGDSLEEAQRICCLTI